MFSRISPSPDASPNSVSARVFPLAPFQPRSTGRKLCMAEKAKLGNGALLSHEQPQFC